MGSNPTHLDKLMRALIHRQVTVQEYIQYMRSTGVEYRRAR